MSCTPCRWRRRHEFGPTRYEKSPVLNISALFGIHGDFVRGEALDVTDGVIYVVVATKRDGLGLG